MSTHVVICKKPSGHNLKVEVLNPGMTEPSVKLLQDHEFTEVLVYGDGTIKLEEIEKPKAE